MKVRMLTTSASPDGGWSAGQVIDRDDGQDLIDAGLAAPHRPGPIVERATGGPQRRREHGGEAGQGRSRS